MASLNFKLKVLSISIIYICAIHKLNAAPLSNFDKIDSLVSISTNEIYNRKIDTLYYKILSADGDWLVEKKLIENNKSITLINSDSVKANYIRITIEKIGVNINNDEKNNDLLIRNCFLKLNITSYDNLLQASNFTIDKFAQDTLSHDTISELNKANFAFAKAEIPKRQTSIFKRIFEPIIVVAAVAVTTFLFFSVRSK